MFSLIENVAVRYLRWRLREGKVFSFWPAKDLRRDFQVADVTRLDEGVVGVRVRTFGTLGASVSAPPFGAIQFVPLREFHRRGIAR